MVLEFIDEEVIKTDEALEFGSLSGPENEQLGPDLSKFALLEATYGIGECECCCLFCARVGAGC